MTMLPAATDFTGASITEAQFKTALTNMRAFLSELLGASGTDKVAALTALGAILCDSLDKTGAYTVVAADKGKVINCSGTFTLSLDAAATLGDGFAFSVWNNGSGTITIDPNASELIDGATTKTLAAGKLAIVYCDGTKFVTVGSATEFARGYQGFTSSGTFTVPAGVSQIHVMCVAGGGGGGGVSAGYNANTHYGGTGGTSTVGGITATGGTGGGNGSFMNSANGVAGAAGSGSGGAGGSSGNVSKDSDPFAASANYGGGGNYGQFSSGYPDYISRYGGIGGAGGVRYGWLSVVSGQNVTVTVGSGGAGGYGDSIYGSAGQPGAVSISW